MVCTVKVFARGSWNFELVHIFLINWIVLLGTHGLHGLHCLFSLVMEHFCSRQFFEVIQLFLDNWIADCFIWHTWFALSVLFCDRNFLLEAVRILSLSK